MPCCSQGTVPMQMIPSELIRTLSDPKNTSNQVVFYVCGEKKTKSTLQTTENKQGARYKELTVLGLGCKELTANT